jgi:formyl-CoA transferase
VYSPRQALDDEIVRGSGAFEWTRYPGVSEEVPLVASPVSLSRTPPRIARRAPRTGEHTDEVLAEAGYSPRDIGQLREQGVI